MTIVGNLGATVKPVGFLNGPSGQLDITSFYGGYSVGNIPMCQVGVPLEVLDTIDEEETDDLYTVTIGPSKDNQYTVFKGYISGDNSRTTSRNLATGINLVHQLGRNMDEHRISAPNLHPSSVDDFTYEFMNVGFGNSVPFVFSGTSYYSSDAGTPLPTQLINGLVANIQQAQSFRTGAGAGAKTETAQDAINALQAIKVLNGTINPSIADALSVNNSDSINAYACKIAEASFTAKRSVWDTISQMMAPFGLLLICDNQGNLYISADMAGFSAPQKNTLDGNYIVTNEKTSLFIRNIKEVNIIGSKVAYSGFGNSAGVGTIVTYPQPGTSNEKGASLAALLPGWLNPIAINYQGDTNGEPPSASNPNTSNLFSATPDAAQYNGILAAQLQYAKMVYLLERNKLRTMSLAGPFAPQVVPGTTATLQPFSAIKAKSGTSGSSINKTYTGYCYQLMHRMNVEERVLETTFFFRNLTTEDPTTLLQTHPIFSDVQPFTWQ